MWVISEIPVAPIESVPIGRGVGKGGKLLGAQGRSALPVKV